jgi:hypothetical protein
VFTQGIRDRKERIKKINNDAEAKSTQVQSRRKNHWQRCLNAFWDSQKSIDQLAKESEWLTTPILKTVDTVDTPDSSPE